MKRLNKLKWVIELKVRIRKIIRIYNFGWAKVNRVAKITVTRFREEGVLGRCRLLIRPRLLTRWKLKMRFKLAAFCLEELQIHILYCMECLAGLEILKGYKWGSWIRRFWQGRRWKEARSSLDIKYKYRRFLWDVFEWRKDWSTDWDRFVIEPRLTFGFPKTLKLWLFLIRWTLYLLIFYWLMWLIFPFGLGISIDKFTILRLGGSSWQSLISTTNALITSLFVYCIAIVDSYFYAGKSLWRRQEPFWVIWKAKRRNQYSHYLRRSYQSEFRVIDVNVVRKKGIRKR